MRLIVIHYLHISVGAFNSTKESQRRSEEAQIRVDATTDTVAESADTRKEMEDLITDSKDEFDRKFNENEKNLKDIDNKLEEMDDNLVDLNEQVPSDSYLWRHTNEKCLIPMLSKFIGVSLWHNNDSLHIRALIKSMCCLMSMRLWSDISTPSRKMSKVMNFCWTSVKM